MEISGQNNNLRLSSWNKAKVVFVKPHQHTCFKGTHTHQLTYTCCEWQVKHNILLKKQN